jgi:hypothetical protein
MTDVDLVLAKKSSNCFCQRAADENTSLARYLVDQPDRVTQVMHDRCAQLDAYLISIDEKHDDVITSEKSSKQRAVAVRSPNDTYEQRQLFYHVNKFWPLKQRAAFAIDDILSSE